MFPLEVKGDLVSSGLPLVAESLEFTNEDKSADTQSGILIVRTLQLTLTTPYIQHTAQRLLSSKYAQSPCLRLSNKRRERAAKISIRPR
jgi:hypothetical protein